MIGFVATAGAAVLTYYVGLFVAAIGFHLTHAGPLGMTREYSLDADGWWSQYRSETVGGILAAFFLVAIVAIPFPPLRRWKAVLPVAAIVLLQPVGYYVWLQRSVARDIDRQGYGSRRAESLVTLRGAKATTQLLEAMRTSAPGASEAAVALLRIEGGPAALSAIALDPAEPPPARLDGAFALAKRGLTTPAIDAAVSDVLRDPRTNRFARLAAAKRLSDRDGPAGPNAKAWLVQLLGDDDPAVRLAAVTAIVSVYGVSDDQPCRVLEGLLGDANPAVRREAQTHLNDVNLRRSCPE